MENLDLKIKLAVLWLFLAVGFSAYSILDMARPGVMEEMTLGGEYEGLLITEELLLFFALFWLIPLAMAFLSLTLKDSASRWANIILSVFLGAIWIIDLIEGGLLLAQYLTDVSMIVVVALIVWYAWKWPKQEVVTKPKE